MAKREQPRCLRMSGRTNKMYMQRSKVLVKRKKILHLDASKTVNQNWA